VEAHSCELAAVRASEAALRKQLEQLRLELQGSDPQVGRRAGRVVLKLHGEGYLLRKSG
jgi:hypothetical protein